MLFSLSLSVYVVITFIIFWVFAYYFKKNNHKNFSIISFILAPIISLLLIANHYGEKIIYIFLNFAIIGTFCEFIFGYIYHLIFKKKLWEYKSLKIGKGGYTSYLAVPFWGIGGLIFWGISLLFFS